MRTSGLFPIRIHLVLHTVGRTPWTADQPYLKADTSTGQHKQRRNADKHPCLEWDSNTQTQRLSGRRYFMQRLWSASFFSELKVVELTINLQSSLKSPVTSPHTLFSTADPQYICRIWIIGYE
jgi:hypothetical protein